ncbi:alanyl-tRNA synthetase [Buchnera aphidicola str. Bp (Baizongia pistaciae)]|uniref:Alanine--tRNA ligase n=1 Tax=Buchnera aphidicola subsp. Baizongia pistaciae (strain Bp) TaxID=224915 RepID=SYA_BUCBP|nr:alanine--tRNA ligase [Buchnera aphidicola]P59420.1 RecName: Full=Alanine--tRNA ligase; AltName: Full=Alanyl-tRNA synthetase; Short=AlaRS [Buchnera aphidicola str. Bp (Baizongia pistaciae)]AAO27083.1 alanyl-tRNA synthetase [Buchnera aphidicola str. Bp (Baizongia pistaciae)]
MIYTSNEICQMFLNFFYKKGHTILPGSTLIPNNDPSLLFTNSGMNQFKDIFIQKNYNFKYNRVTTLQNCLRTGGKHNDFENVGYTPQHHTFFQMLGNFSFRDYFKLDAILYAWKFLTSKEQLNLSKEKLWITVYQDDLESYNIWKNIIKIDKHKIIKIGNKYNSSDSDNFWQMGEIGPCGPCTEIFYDYGNTLPGTIPGNNGCNVPRFVEIWNIVFIQFNKLSNGKLIKLTESYVDTGMGLERISAVINNVTSNYEIDLFKPLIKHILELSTVNTPKNKSIYVIADHIRACSFIISENIIPSNEKHGYVLRRIIRRAIRHGHNLGIKSLFLHKLIPTLINTMGKFNPVLKKQQNKIENVLKLEEQKFIETLEKGLKLLHKELKQIQPKHVLSGKLAFNLYDTFGFPIDLTIDICKEHNISINIMEFKRYLNQHKQNSINKNFLNTRNAYYIEDNNINIKTHFVGYQFNKTQSIINNIIIKNNKKTLQINDYQNSILFLNETPFYGESGGQIGDSGIIHNKTGKFIVNCTKMFGNIIGHVGTLASGYLNIHDTVCAEINLPKRKSIQINHTATHLLHASLRKILGKHVFQKGSFISDQSLKFDFSHNAPMNLREIQEVENIINKKIQKNISVSTTLTTLQEIQNKKVMALFQDKYKDKVRMISINDFSVELCGGTHTKYTGDIGLFKITSEISISSGIRRIEAVTGKHAISIIHHQEKTINNIANMLNSKTNNIEQTITKLLNNNIHLKKQIYTLYNQNIYNIVNSLSKHNILIKDVNIIIKNLKNENLLSLRNIVDKLKNRFKCSVIIISSIINNKSIIIVGVTRNVTDRISALDILNKLTKKLGGRGGGKNNIAEGGIKNLISLPIELKKIKTWISSRL